MSFGLVSIITPVYNGERFIAQTIESVLAQTYKDWEMIIVIDGSKDGSEQIAKDYSLKDSRVKVFSQPNAGSAAARNNGIRRAKGRYITFLDADDLWDKCFIEEQLDFLHRHNAQLVCAAYRRIDENSNECLRPFFPPVKIRYKDLLRTCSISCLTAMIDTINIGKPYLREDLGSLRDDYALWLDIIKKIGVVYGNQNVIASYRIISTQTTSNKRKMIKPQYLVYRRVEGLGVMKSLYYLMCWAIEGVKKYRK